MGCVGKDLPEEEGEGNQGHERVNTDSIQIVVHDMIRTVSKDRMHQPISDKMPNYILHFGSTLLVDIYI